MNLVVMSARSFSFWLERTRFSPRCNQIDSAIVFVAQSSHDGSKSEFRRAIGWKRIHISRQARLDDQALVPRRGLWVQNEVVQCQSDGVHGADQIDVDDTHVGLLNINSIDYDAVVVNTHDNTRRLVVYFTYGPSRTGHFQKCRH